MSRIKQEDAEAEKLRKDSFISFRSIRFKINLVIAVCGIILMFFSLWLLSDSMGYVERDLTNDRLSADIRYALDELGTDWRLQDGALYCGSLRVGDGTSENLPLEERMVHFEHTTGSFYYLFMRTDNDSELVWIDKGRTGYQQGHYIRVCGSTRGSNGESLVGSYIDKNVADRLEEEGLYAGEANVNGTMIYCRYEPLRDADGELIGTVVVGRSITELKDLIAKQKTRGFVLIIVMMLLISAALGGVVTVMLGAIARIKTRLRLIGTGEFPSEPLEIHTNDEFSDVAGSINEMVESLREKSRIGAELSLATDIQANMLPRIFPPFPEYDEFDIYATMTPAKEVGGDFYDFFMLDDHRIAVVIADVSGKGVPAALFMVITKTLIKNYTQLDLPPAEVFTKVNALLCEGNEVDLFVTAWLGILDLETGRLTYTNAGHNPPLLQQNGSSFEYLRSKPCLVLAGMEMTRYTQHEVQLQPGDRLYLYTDGVTEATDLDKELYGEDRLRAYLSNHPEKDATQMLHAVKDSIDAFVGEAEQFDDITMLMLDYKSRRTRPEA